MITAAPQTTKPAVRIVINGTSLVDQLSAQAGDRKYLAGKLAYDFLGHTVSKPLSEIQSTALKLDLDSIRSRDLANDTEAALAFAAAALADVGRSRTPRTVTEKVEAAMEILDEKLSAGW